MPVDYASTLTAELQAHGATGIHIDRAHKHPRICFAWQGRQQFYVMPSSPSDRRGADNALTDLRKMLGVKRIITKSARAPKQRNATEAPVMLTITLRADPFAVLAQWRPPTPEVFRWTRTGGKTWMVERIDPL